ncbi:MAG: serine hydrolase [Anaerolineae bacterium]|nr:serine hydrolase [Anaerolineae bacterium]
MTFRRVLLPLCLLTVLTASIVFAQPNPTGVTAEAVGMANVRAAPDIGAGLVGQIVAGTRYPVLGRSEFFPWLLLGRVDNGQPLGWVFMELMLVQGNAAAVPLSDLVIGVEGSPSTATPSAQTPSPGTPAVTTSPVQPPATAAPVPAGAVTGTVLGEINVRYGPGVDFPRVGVARAGDTLDLIRTHTTLPWVEIRYPDSPSGTGWVAVELITVNGDLSVLPTTSQTSFALPTLTPTPSPVNAAAVLGESAVPISPEFAALGNQLFALMLAAGFDPATSRIGTFFVMNLQTGEALSTGTDIAFSGMSMNKIAILADYYRMLASPANDVQANTVAQAMVCSENISTNRMLASIGGGNPYRGAESVSAFLDELGLGDSFIFTPFANDPFITPEAPMTRVTDVNQQAAQPDPYNQLTANETGGLLNAIYQCAENDRGPLLDTFPDQFTQTECRQMLHVMSYNKIGSLIEVGIPADVRIAHKHGWINDTHGDSAVVFSPGGDYIFVVALHNPDWLNFSESAPLIEEMSRTIYNYFNPDVPLLETRTVEGLGDVNACINSLLTSPVVPDLMSATVGG